MFRLSARSALRGERVVIMELQIILYLGNFSWETLLCGVPRFLAACLQRGPLGYCFRSPEPCHTLMVVKRAQPTTLSSSGTVCISPFRCGHHLPSRYDLQFSKEHLPFKPWIVTGLLHGLIRLQKCTICPDKCAHRPLGTSYLRSIFIRCTHRLVYFLACS